MTTIKSIACLDGAFFQSIEVRALLKITQRLNGQTIIKMLKFSSHSPWIARARTNQSLQPGKEKRNWPRISLFGPYLDQINYLLVTFLLNWRQTDQCIHLEGNIRRGEGRGRDEKLIPTQELFQEGRRRDGIRSSSYLIRRWRQQQPLLESKSLSAMLVPSISQSVKYSCRKIDVIRG